MNPNEIIARCLSAAQTELNKIPYKDNKLKLELVYTHYEYVDGEFIQVSEGDRGHVSRNRVAETEEEFIEYLINKTVTRFAFAYECKHRRPFEDNRRQVNEIIIDCYEHIDDKYQYTLMIKLKDNIHIYFDLLDYYVQVCKKYLDSNVVSGEEKKRLSFIATKQYARTNGGIYDVAFCFDWVRYQLERFLEVHPGQKETFLAHEEQFQRLLALEKADPHEQKWYRLGVWDKDVFGRAERILEEVDAQLWPGKVAFPKDTERQNVNPTSDFKGLTANFLAQKNAKKKSEQPLPKEEKSASAYQCAFYMLIVLLHTKRNLERDLERLLMLSKDVDITLFKKPLEQLFVTDEYGVFGRIQEELRESARMDLGM